MSNIREMMKIIHIIVSVKCDLLISFYDIYNEVKFLI